MVRLFRENITGGEQMLTAKERLRNIEESKKERLKKATLMLREEIEKKLSNDLEEQVDITSCMEKCHLEVVPKEIVEELLNAGYSIEHAIKRYADGYVLKDCEIVTTNEELYPYYLYLELQVTKIPIESEQLDSARVETRVYKNGKIYASEEVYDFSIDIKEWIGLVVIKNSLKVKTS